MIISASRRTDIPACYSSWFFNRIKERYVLVRNPYNPKLISRISLDPAVVDCIVFWTKNPALMLPRLEELNDYKYYFQFTLNPYGQPLEPHLPSLVKRIETFKRLSDKIGREKVIWRYDPILLNDTYNIRFHQEQFAGIVRLLKDYTDTCMLGFIDHYRHLRTILARFNISPLQQEEIDKIALSFQSALSGTSIRLYTCTVKTNLHHLNIPDGCCIDSRLIEKITGFSLSAQKDKNQRSCCRCTESIDIGAYDTCLNGCLYCYAVKIPTSSIADNFCRHDAMSPLLTGHITPEDTIKDRVMKSLRKDQLALF